MGVRRHLVGSWLHHPPVPIAAPGWRRDKAAPGCVAGEGLSVSVGTGWLWAGSEHRAPYPDCATDTHACAGQGLAGGDTCGRGAEGREEGPPRLRTVAAVTAAPVNASGKRHRSEARGPWAPRAGQGEGRGRGRAGGSRWAGCLLSIHAVLAGSAAQWARALSPTQAASPLWEHNTEEPPVTGLPTSPETCAPTRDRVFSQRRFRGVPSSDFHSSPLTNQRFESPPSARHRGRHHGNVDNAAPLQRPEPYSCLTRPCGRSSRATSQWDGRKRHRPPAMTNANDPASRAVATGQVRAPHEERLGRPPVGDGKPLAASCGSDKGRFTQQSTSRP